MARRTSQPSLTRRALTSNLSALVNNDSDTWPTDFIDSHLQKLKVRRTRPGVFSVSSVPTDDDLYLALQFMGRPAVPTRLDPRMQRIFDLGTDQHKRWQKYCRDCGIAGKAQIEEVVWVRSLRLFGHIDVTVSHPRTGAKRLVDFKTSKSSKFDDIKGFALPGHAEQVMGYMGATGIKDGCIIYINKDDSDYKVIPVKFDLKLWNEWYVKRLTRLLRMIENREVPICTYGGKGCEFAPDCQHMQITDEDAASLYLYDTDTAPHFPDEDVDDED